jgi:ribosomal protein S18 acetylase RimI-like enzyme
LRELDASRQPWIGAVPDERMRTLMLEQQFLARRRGYAAAYPAAEARIIEVDGVAAGALLTETRADVLHLVDIALLPAMQGRGVGTVVLRGLLTVADAGGRGIRLQVDPGNRVALGLYRRLGFVEVNVTETEIEMERPRG